jgi:hypothetical protein
MEIHMKRIAIVAVALGIAAPPAFAQPTKMSDAQLDGITGGLADVTVTLDNSGNPNIQVNPNVAVNPNVSVSVGVLGGGLGAGLGQ